VTALQLLTLISAALLIQIAAGIAFGVCRGAPRDGAPSNGAPRSLRPVWGSLVSREVLPFYLSLGTLALSTLAIDALLHLLDAVWIGRYLGIPGTLLILGSFGYSLRKRKLISKGQPMTLLRLHERMAWTGALLILVHAGIHFNAILGWLAVWAMLINVGSGLTGKYLLQRSRKRLEQTKVQLREQGLSPGKIEEHLYWDSITVDVVKQWRSVHFPITLAFAVLALGHIIAVFLFWAWK